MQPVGHSLSTPDIYLAGTQTCFYAEKFRYICQDILVSKMFWSFVSVVLKLAIAVLIKAYIFRHSDWNDLIFFGHFKNISVYDRKNPDPNNNQYWRIGKWNVKNFLHQNIVKRSIYLQVTDANACLN